VGTPAQTVDMVVVWFDSNTNRYAVSNVAKLTIT
jgi:type IV secretory pathway component VirB8